MNICTMGYTLHTREHVRKDSGRNLAQSQRKMTRSSCHTTRKFLGHHPIPTRLANAQTRELSRVLMRSAWNDRSPRWGLPVINPRPISLGHYLATDWPTDRPTNQVTISRTGLTAHPARNETIIKLGKRFGNAGSCNELCPIAERDSSTFLINIFRLLMGKSQLLSLLAIKRNRGKERTPRPESTSEKKLLPVEHRRATS